MHWKVCNERIRLKFQLGNLSDILINRAICTLAIGNIFPSGTHMKDFCRKTKARKISCRRQSEKIGSSKPRRCREIFCAYTK